MPLIGKDYFSKPLALRHLKVSEGLVEALTGFVPLTLRGGGSGPTDIIRVETVSGFRVLTFGDIGTWLLRSDELSSIGQESANRPEYVHVKKALASKGLFQRAVTAAQITVDQNAWNPDADAYYIRVTSDAARNINGIDNGGDGRKLLIQNLGSFTITLVNESGSASAEDRIVTGSGANHGILAGRSAILIYDSSATRWRQVSPVV